MLELGYGTLAAVCSAATQWSFKMNIQGEKNTCLPKGRSKNILVFNYELCNYPCALPRSWTLNDAGHHSTKNTQNI